MKKKSLLASVILVLALCFAACGEKSADPEDPMEEYAVTPYWISGDFLETGDESLAVLIAPDEYKLECAAGEQYMTLLSALQTVPGELTGADTMVTERIQFRSASVEDGVAYVDFAEEDLSGGSMEEALLISQIVESLLDSFEEVQSVQLLVNGERAETLMGHYDITEAFTEGIYGN